MTEDDGSAIETSSAPLALPGRRSEPAPDPLFDKFWTAYPRKVGRVGAHRAWERVVRRGGVPGRIISAAERFRDDCRAGRTEPKFIPHPASWLRDGRYGDEDPEPQPAVAFSAPPTGRLNDEQVLAAVIRLAADQEHPVTTAGEIVRVVRENSPGITWSGFPAIFAERVVELAAMPYAEYLQTPEWQERRKIMLKLAGYRCKVCNGAERLHVHHRTYERRGNELPADLTVLCDDCHALYHGKGRLAVEGEILPS